MALHAHLVDFGGRKDEDLEALEEFFTDEPYVEVFTQVLGVNSRG